MTSRVKRGRQGEKPKKSKFTFVLLGLAVIALIGCVVVGVMSIRPAARPVIPTPKAGQGVIEEITASLGTGLLAPPAPASREPIDLSEYALEPATLNELLDIPARDLDQVDVARMNLLCASGLPATRDLDIEHALATLDRWAEHVAAVTDRHLYRVTDPRYVEHYDHSEAQYRAEMLAQVLHEDLGVKYDPEAVRDFSFADPSVAFIHGMIPPEGNTTDDTPGGTCASMPVLYLAVGRRLGYPLKLALTDSHIFVRWDGENHPNPGFRGQFNCEITNGFNRFDDGYYATWPTELSAEQIERQGCTTSLSPAEEMAEFLAARGHHGVDVRQFGFAARCYENAVRYDATRPRYRAWFLEAVGHAPDYQTTTLTLAAMMPKPDQGFSPGNPAGIYQRALPPEPIDPRTGEFLAPGPHLGTTRSSYSQPMIGQAPIAAHAFPMTPPPASLPRTSRD